MVTRTAVHNWLKMPSRVWSILTPDLKIRASKINTKLFSQQGACPKSPCRTIALHQALYQYLQSTSIMVERYCKALYLLSPYFFEGRTKFRVQLLNVGNGEPLAFCIVEMISPRNTRIHRLINVNSNIQIAFCMSKNSHNSRRTRHVKLQYHYFSW